MVHRTWVVVLLSARRIVQKRMIRPLILYAQRLLSVGVVVLVVASIVAYFTVGFAQFRMASASMPLSRRAGIPLGALSVRRKSFRRA